jgi:hypothetical protein
MAIKCVEPEGGATAHYKPKTAFKGNRAEGTFRPISNALSCNTRVLIRRAIKKLMTATEKETCKLKLPYLPHFDEVSGVVILS